MRVTAKLSSIQSMTTDQLVAQLYTVRHQCKTSEQTAETLQRIRNIGFSAVEVAGIVDLEAAELRAMTEASGLVIAAIHDRDVLDDPAKVVKRLNALNCEIVAYSYPSGFDLTQESDIRRLVKKLAAAGARFRAEGKIFCYHHHSIEFRRYGSRTLLEFILKEVDPADLGLELDTYWIQHGGGTPGEWCQRLKNRIPIIHLKDYGSIGGTPTMMEVGNGNLDWSNIISSAESSGCKWFAVEQDVCPGDPLESLKLSFDYLQAHLIAK
jgi:sugar phosphate isomerase/epimerase